MILAGDIGGTNSRLALYEVKNNSFELARQQTYPSRDYDQLEDVLLRFVEDERISGASFGVPGPVVQDTVVTSNLPWIVGGANLRKALGIKDIFLLNDLEAAAWGIGELRGEDLYEIKPGENVIGNRALIAPGTGLGEAFLIWDRDHYLVCSSEGGHTDFAQTNDTEIELYRFLRQKLKRVSWERLLSGPGILSIYQFLRSREVSPEPAELTEGLRGDNPSFAIVQAALRKESETCVNSVKLFVSLLAKEAGNLALKVMSSGGVYVGGGICPAILEFLRTEEFAQSFSVKGRLSPVLEKMPVRVVLRNDTGLLGAARYAYSKIS